MWCSNCGSDKHLAGKCLKGIQSTFNQPRAKQKPSLEERWGELNGSDVQELAAQVAELTEENRVLRGKLMQSECSECERRKKQSRDRVARSRERKRAAG